MPTPSPTAAVIASEGVRAERARIVEILIEEGVLEGDSPVMVRRPKHGSCCTCQDCGFAHDECVCQHNRILNAIHEWDEEAKPQAEASP